MEKGEETGYVMSVGRKELGRPGGVQRTRDGAEGGGVTTMSAVAAGRSTR